MALSKTLKKGEGSGVEIKPDSYIGLVRDVIHIGTHKNTYKGVETTKDQVAIRFELQDVLTEKGTPVTVTKTFTVSAHPKAGLIELGEALGLDVDDGVDFDEFVGKSTLVNMGFNEAKTKVNVKGFSSLPSVLRSQLKPLMNTPVVYLDVDLITDTQLKELPEWLSKVISERIRPQSNSSTDTSSGSVEL